MKIEVSREIPGLLKPEPGNWLRKEVHITNKKKIGSRRKLAKKPSSALAVRAYEGSVISLPEVSQLALSPFILDGQHRTYGAHMAFRKLSNEGIGSKAQRSFSNRPEILGQKKRQATKSVARLDNPRRSNVSEWSNYNTYR